MARRVANHSMRTHANGKATSSKHLDRNFQCKDNHIDTKLSYKNTYWINPDLGIEAESFDELERKFYEENFADHISAVNAKHEASRHYERMINTEKLRTGKRTCVEDTLLYFGDKEHELPPEVHDNCIADFVEWHTKTFPQCVILDYATHRDEPNSAQHTELRTVWCAIHENGYMYPNQTKALEQMGIKNNGQKYDNAKKTYTQMCREKQAEILLTHGYVVELTPKEGKGGQALEEFKRDRAIEERKEQEKFTLTKQEVEKAKSEIRPNKFNKNEVVMPASLASQLVVSSLERDKYKAEYEEARKFKSEAIDKEKMELRIQLHREREEHDKTKQRLRDFTECVKSFLEQRGLLQLFREAVEVYKLRKEREHNRLIGEQKIAMERSEVHQRTR